MSNRGILNTGTGFGRRVRWIVVLIALTSSIFGDKPPKDLQRFTYTEYLMGVDTRLVVFSPDKKAAEDACSAAFERIADLDALMSDYRPNSELMRLCDRAGGPPVKVSPDLMKVFRRAEEVSRRSDGMFDITVGPVVHLWREARKTHLMPSRRAIQAARLSVGWQNVVLDIDNGTVRLLKPGMRLDLGAIGKGFADDEAQKVLKAHGITRALVQMGGDIVVTGPPPGRNGWIIRIPDANGDGKPKDFQLSDCAISTSGDTEQNVVIGGVKYSHVVDPHTGMALTTSVQATIIAKDGLTADPVSTALTLLDPPGRERLLAAYPGIKAFVRTMR